MCHWIGLAKILNFVLDVVLLGVTPRLLLVVTPRLLLGVTPVARFLIPANLQQHTRKLPPGRTTIPRRKI